jgi:hypothetical protein
MLKISARRPEPLHWSSSWEPLHRSTLQAVNATSLICGGKTFDPLDCSNRDGSNGGKQPLSV